MKVLFKVYTKVENEWGRTTTAIDLALLNLKMYMPKTCRYARVCVCVRMCVFAQNKIKSLLEPT